MSPSEASPPSTSPFRATPRQDRSTKSIDTIVDAAVRVAARVGLEDLSTVLVAKEAGVSVGKVYYWFEDKTALVEAARRRTHSDFDQFLRDSLSTVDSPDSLDFVARFVHDFVGYIKAHPGSLALLEHDREPDGSSPFRELMHNLVEQLLVSQVADIGQHECDLVADTLITMLVSLTAQALRRTGQRETEATTEAVYVITAYLHCRYPGQHDPVWSHSDFGLQPARASFQKPSAPLFPVRFEEPALQPTK